MTDLPHLTDEEIGHAREMVEIIHPLVLGTPLREHMLTICDDLVAERRESARLQAAWDASYRQAMENGQALAAAQAKLDAIEGLARWTICGGRAIPAGTEPTHGCWSGGTEWIRATDIDAIAREVGSE